jgi:uncharacterized membrane protein
VDNTEGSTVLNVNGTSQIVTALVLSGSQAGQTVTFDNDYVELKPGEIFYLNHTVQSGDGREFYSVQDAYRMPVLYFFIALFVLLVILVGGMQGVRGLVSLGGSLALILYVLLPGILHGFSPVLVAVGVSSFIIILGSYVTHGFNKTTTSAVVGMIITVIITGVLAAFAVRWANFSGAANDEAVYLNLNTHGNINLVGILIGGIMIGLLGVLYDVAIGQAVSVEELHHIAPHISKRTIFRRAMRIGREHIGALVNTLAIAYVGASLPLLLLFSMPPVDIGQTVNKEIFAVEIIRALVGSIGLVLAVPITTFLSTFMLVNKKGGGAPSIEMEAEKKALEKYEHKHS